MAFNSFGGSRIIGQGQPQAVPIQLDPVPYKGAIAYGVDGLIYVSNGLAWTAVGAGTQGTTGIQGDAGLQGLQGDYGPGFTIIGSVPDVDAGGDQQLTLNNAFPGATVGDGVIDNTDDELWIYDGALWVNIGSFRGVQGFTGFQGTQGAQGARGDEGIQGSRGFRGFQGPQGVQGFTGIQGVQGIQGIQGTQGVQGVQGTTGIQGDVGIQGIQGVQGVQGIQGTTGIQGDVGIQGTTGSYGGISFEFAFDTNNAASDPGSKKLRFSNTLASSTNAIHLNDIAGPGTTDISAIWNALDASTNPIKGYIKLTKVDDISVFAVFQVSDVTDNTGWFTLAVTYVSSNGAFSLNDDLIVSLVESGAQGVQGPQSIQGTTGIQGDIGFQGTQGIQGQQSTQGIQGDTGIQGMQGTQGVQGVQGDTGIQGVQGLLGLQGIQGDVGIQGNQGTQGFQGVQGNQGVQGTQGFQGTTGIQGDIGFQGTQGESIQGSQGTTGFQGAQGTQGHQGVQGLQGTQGFQGTTGIQGDAGFQGFAGAYGGASFEYVFTSDVAPTGPATGRLKLNNVDVTAATILRINNTDANGNDLSNWLQTFNTDANAMKGYVKVSSISNINEFMLYSLTATSTTATTHNLTVTFLSNSTNGDATYFTANPGVIFTFSKSGGEGFQGTQGAQGTQGIQGDLGFQGTTGAGSQGTTGIQGDLGFQGVQGFPGPIGPQGIQGTEGFQGSGGLQGETGGFGGVTFDYTYSTNVANSDPGPGILKFNSANLSAASILYIDDRDDAFNDIQPFLRTIDDSTSPIKGHFKISEKLAPANFVIFTISSLTENAGYFSVTSAFVSGSVSNFADAEDIIITFARTGDIGPLGPQGVQGFEGFQGPTGVQGGSGGLGIQGTQGIQGDLGAQGLSGFIGGDGTQGSQGTQGTQSVQGIAGLDGDEGFQGSQGTQGLLGEGAQGIQGTDGSQGIAGIGATGIQGFQGIQGDVLQGIQGTQGLNGPPGFGNQGTQGFQGPQGTDGETGSQGVQGLGGQGTSGLQGIQGLDGDVGGQGVQGLLGDGGFQGTQGFQGVAGEGADGVQGDAGFQGTQGLIGDSGVGGFQGPQGIQGGFGTQGIDGGLGNTGLQGVQGIIGDIGIQGAIGGGTQGLQGGQGVQGDIGIQGFPGQGTQGIQGVQAAQGVQGERGFQGTQGMQGFGPEGAVNNIQNVHELGVQSTPLFITFVEGGSTTQPLRATTGPNPGGESNFYYTSNVDELTVENMQVEGNLTVVGTLNAAAISGNNSNLHFPSDVSLTFGGSEGAAYIEQYFNNAGTSLMISANTSITTAVRFIEMAGGTDVFTFNMQTGNFTATGDVESNSDERLKENIETIENALEKVSNMRGVYFDMKARPGVRKVGLIAQEVEKVLPEVVSTDPDKDNIKSVAYANVVGLLVEAIKELKIEVDTLKSQ